ncbi:hypothetical protein Cflav_PD0720 [Pedosphaera parvula Ellin514]|uniref:Uncharacterized protein n=1 Tax=Pedosphaera parvula (strain Ellin514) TaxID=320771 RepID=B9XR72_PEDPL|nr:hypothetical protein Cflav_PD0720 [Pedosphaera parvula Ellin514]
MAVFLGLLGTTVCFAEGVFTITYGFSDNIQRFRHIQLSFLKLTLACIVPTTLFPLLTHRLMVFANIDYLPQKGFKK